MIKEYGEDLEESFGSSSSDRIGGGLYSGTSSIRLENHRVSDRFLDAPL